MTTPHGRAVASTAASTSTARQLLVAALEAQDDLVAKLSDENAELRAAAALMLADLAAARAERDESRDDLARMTSDRDALRAALRLVVDRGRPIPIEGDARGGMAGSACTWTGGSGNG